MAGSGVDVTDTGQLVGTSLSQGRTVAESHQARGRQLPFTPQRLQDHGRAGLVEGRSRQRASTASLKAGSYT